MDLGIILEAHQCVSRHLLIFILTYQHVYNPHLCKDSVRNGLYLGYLHHQTSLHSHYSEFEEVEKTKIDADSATIDGIKATS